MEIFAALTIIGFVLYGLFHVAKFIVLVFLELVVSIASPIAYEVSRRNRH